MSEQHHRSDLVIQLLTEIRDELREMNARAPKQRTRRESVLAGELPVIAQIWNEWADPFFARVESMSTASLRYRQADERWKETLKVSTEEKARLHWVAIVQKINRSSFCRGNNDKKWVASIDFLVRPDSGAKVLEGKYDEKKDPKKESPKFEFDPALNAWKPVR